VAWHWLVLAVATFWVLPCGTRVEDAEQQGLPFLELARPRRAPSREPRARGQQRRVGLFRQGHSWLRVHLLRGRLWRRLWLAPASWPEPAPQLHISCHLFQQVA
jgi:hypothetical protein